MADASESRLEVTWADGRFTPEQAAQSEAWREMTPYELAVLERLLEVEFEGREHVRGHLPNVLVRPLDTCGCIEFLPGGVANSIGMEARMVVDSKGPGGLRVSLTVRGFEPLWLEFHRFGGDDHFRPDPFELEPFACG